MADLTWPTTTSGAVVAIFGLWYFRRDIRAWWVARTAALTAETQTQNQKLQFDSVAQLHQAHADDMARAERRHAAAIQDQAQAHARTHEADQQTITELRATAANNKQAIELLQEQIRLLEERHQILNDDKH